MPSLKQADYPLAAYANFFAVCTLAHRTMRSYWLLFEFGDFVAKDGLAKHADHKAARVTPPS